MDRIEEKSIPACFVNNMKHVCFEFKGFVLSIFDLGHNCLIRIIHENEKMGPLTYKYYATWLGLRYN